MHSKQKASLWSNTSKWDIIVLLLIVSSILISTITLSLQPSYWGDELFSVVASSESFSSLYQILLADVHPPLYQVLLKLWISIFGDSEFATRSLSWLFAMAALVLLYRYACSNYGHCFAMVASAFFVSNPLFGYYANETRSYAMLLFFSTLLLSIYPYRSTNVTKLFLVTCVALSLTHYFGLILSCIILIVCLVQRYKQPRTILEIVLTSIICLLWPVHHVLAGTVLAKTSGAFWIEVNGFLDSFAISASVFFPKTALLGASLLWIGIIAAVCLAIYTIKKSKEKDLKLLAGMMLTVSVIVSLVLVIVAIIDLWTPISVDRNYIVLLPFFSLLIGGFTTLFIQFFQKKKNIFRALFFIFCLLSIVRTTKRIIVWKAKKEIDIKIIQTMKNLYFEAK